MKAFKILIFLFLFSKVNSQEPNFDSLYAVWINHSLPDTARLEAMYDYAWAGYVSTEPDSAIYFGQLMYDLAKKANSVQYQAKALKTIGYANFNKGNFSIALDYYKDCMILF